MVACVAGFGAAAGFDQMVEDASLYAAELFGKPTQLIYPTDMTPTVVLTLKDEPQVGDPLANFAIDPGSIARVTFDFQNGEFSEAILPGDLVCSGTAADGTALGTSPCVADTGVKIHEGGAVGDTSVTFEVTIGATAVDISPAVNPAAGSDPEEAEFMLTLTAPAFKASGRVTVSTSIETRQGDIPRMVKRCSSPDDPTTTTMNEADPCEAVVRTAKALTASTKAGAGGTVKIDIDDFTMLDMHKEGAAKGKPTSNTLSSYTFEVTNVKGTDDILGADGEALEEDAAAVLTVTVDGDLNEGDMVDVDGTKLTIPAAGGPVRTNVTLASSSRGLGDVTPDVVGSAANLYKKAVAVKYTPAGKVELIHGNEIDVTFEPSFARVENAAIKAEMKTAGLMIAGVSSDLKAYAIPASTNGKNDKANVRVRCVDGDRMSKTHKNMCRTFIQCWGDDGMGGVGEHGDGVYENATIVLSAEDLETASGVAAMGRHSCRILASGDTAVQVLVRDGTTGTLVNNTFVSD